MGGMFGERKVWLMGRENSWGAMEQCFLKRSWKHIQLQNGRRRRRDLLI
jgi:hypothetical protein